LVPTTSFHLLPRRQTRVPLPRNYSGDVRLTAVIYCTFPVALSPSRCRGPLENSAMQFACVSRDCSQLLLLTQHLRRASIFFILARKGSRVFSKTRESEYREHRSNPVRSARQFGTLLKQKTSNTERGWEGEKKVR
jgi:hypothetical protein